MPRRRKLLTAIGGTAIGIGLGSTSVNARDEGEKPSEMVPTDTPSPGPFGLQKATTGKWLTFGFGWLADDPDASDEEQCEQINDEIFEKRDWRVELPERTIDYDESDQYWARCSDYNENGRKARFWQFSRQPLPPGEYEMALKVRFNEQVTRCDLFDPCRTFEPGDVRILSNTLKVETRGGK